MTRILFDTVVAALVAYPRSDEGPVEGLDPRYLDLALIQESEPTYDAATQRLEPTEAIDATALTCTRGWNIVTLPTPPDWAAFKAQAIESPALNGIMGEALVETPVAAGALASALLRAEQGDVSDFRASWVAICAAVPAAAAAAPGFQQVAEACHLPAEFVAALEPPA